MSVHFLSFQVSKPTLKVGFESDMIGDKRKVLIMLAAPGVMEPLVDEGLVIAGIYESPVTLLHCVHWKFISLEKERSLNRSIPVL